MLDSPTAKWPVAVDLDMPMNVPRETLFPSDTLFPDAMAFSPSGDALLVSCEGEEGGAGRIEWISLHTGRRWGLYGFGVDRQYYSLDFPVFSPNGKWIAADSDSWAVWRPGGYCDTHQKGAGLVILDVHAEHARRIASVDPNGLLVWSSDGRSILYRTGCTLKAVDVRTGATRQVFTRQRESIPRRGVYKVSPRRTPRTRKAA